MLPHLCLVALELLPEALAHLILRHLITQSQRYLFITDASSRGHPRLYAGVLQKIIRRYNKKLFRHLTSLGDPVRLDYILWELLHGVIFLHLQTKEDRLRLVDVYLNEGSKVLFRFSAALLIIKAEEILQCRDCDSFHRLLVPQCTQLTSNY